MSNEGLEDDYMSDSFLKSLEKNDVKPGLTFSRSTKRKHELEKKKQTLDPKKRIVSESEVRTSGLEKPIDETNKGFQLLQKMGFKNDGEMKKPIGIEIKAGRTGLGMESDTIRKLIDIESGRLNQYKLKTALNVCERWRVKDLKSSQRSCLDLDSEAHIQAPLKEHFWPRQILGGMEEKVEGVSVSMDSEQVEDLIDITNKLEDVTQYLRSFHKFCLWCGIKFESCEDMALNCPGDDRESHTDLL